LYFSTHLVVLSKALNLNSVNTSHVNLALRVAAVGLWEWHIPEDRMEWSDRVYEIHGLRLGEFDGAMGAYRALIHPDDLAPVTDVMHRSGDIEFRIVRPGGEVRWVRMSVESSPGTLAGAVMDITGSKETEDFVHRAIHDLREPTRTVASFAELLARNPAGGSDYVSFIRDGARQMRAVVDGLQALFATVAWRPERVDTATLTEDSSVVRGPLPEVWGDRAALRQLFSNLLSNARRFRRPAVPLRVEISAVRDGEDYWEFCIRDNGLGFEPAQATELFQPFRRLHSRDISGAGVGLALCRKIVHRHGGRIWAQGIPSQGTAVHFTLPMEPDVSDNH
jgi:signal transduction histidine kinase